MKKNFFIIGLPRSRTAWFSALFNTADDVFCYHDGINGCRTAEDFKQKLDACPESIVGDSDSGLALVDLSIFPDAKIVVIHRNMDECAESLDEFIGGGIDQNRAIMEIATEYLEGINAGLHIEFNDIDERIDEIFTFCTGKELDPRIKELFSNFMIQLKEFKFDENTLRGAA